MNPKTLASYLMMIGGGLTIISSLLIPFGYASAGYSGRFYASLGEVQLAFFALSLLSGLGILFFSHVFLAKLKRRFVSSLAIAALSIAGLFAVIVSYSTGFFDTLLSGPPISFLGGIIGASLSRSEGMVASHHPVD